MSILSYSSRRTLFDSTVLLVTAISAYVIGYVLTLNLGDLSYAVILPNIFLITITYFHIVLRKGRRFDERAHNLSYELLKTLIFSIIAGTAYISGKSVVQGFKPSNLVSASFMLVSILIGVYLMAYRENE